MYRHAAVERRKKYEKHNRPDNDDVVRVGVTRRRRHVTPTARITRTCIIITRRARVRRDFHGSGVVSFRVYRRRQYY